MPRALTEQEKCRLCQRLLDKGRDIVLSYGIKKISVDDITRAAGMAKGSFYHHFESKEKYLYELVRTIRSQIFVQAEKIIQSGDNLKENTKAFLMDLFHIKEMVFFLKYCNDINELIDSIPENNEYESGQIDTDMFVKLLILAGIDISKIKSGVVHNFMHTLHMIMDCELMIEDDLPETFELIMNGFISYLFKDSSVEGDVK